MVFIPGKVILSGEHAAVYGKLALSVSIDRGIAVSVVDNQSIEYAVDKKGIIGKAIEVAGGEKSLSLKIDSQLPVGSGLGSSAAMAAAIIKSVKEYLGKQIDDDELFQLTMECEKVAHGTPSGIDPATVIYRGLIAFTKGKPIERLMIKSPFKILVFNSGNPVETSKEMIVDVVGNNPNNQVIVGKIGRITNKIRNLLINGGKISDLINANGLLLEELGVVGNNAVMISKQLRKLGYGVKISGAGGKRVGSGAMIVVGGDFVKAKKFLDNEQIDYFETEIGKK